MTDRLSIRAYARHRGVSDTAVRKAIEAGRITPNADGTINAAQADAQWSKNTDAAQQRGKHKPFSNEAIAGIRETLGESAGAFEPKGGGTTLLQAKTANEVLKAQTNRVRLARLKGELVNRDQAVAHVFKMARAERDAWLNWPARVAAQMAADLNADGHTLHVLLEKAVRNHLIELGDLAVRLD